MDHYAWVNGRKREKKVFILLECGGGRGNEEEAKTVDLRLKKIDKQEVKIRGKIRICRKERERKMEREREREREK